MTAHCPNACENGQQPATTTDEHPLPSWLVKRRTRVHFHVDAFRSQAPLSLSLSYTNTKSCKAALPQASLVGKSRASCNALVSNNHTCRMHSQMAPKVDTSWHLESAFFSKPITLMMAGSSTEALSTTGSGFYVCFPMVSIGSHITCTANRYLQQVSYIFEDKCVPAG